MRRVRARVLFLRRYGSAMRAQAGSPATMLTMLARVAALVPTQTRRSEESQALSNSHPAPAGLCGERRGRTHARGRRARAISRHGAVGDLRRARGCDAGAERACPDARRCPGAAVRHGACFAHDAEQIHDYLPAGARPSVVLMNPPFFGLPEHRGPGCGRGSEASRLGAGPPCRGWAGRHHRRDPRPDRPAGREAFARLQERGQVVFTAALDGRAYARHGTTAETRLTVIDRVPAEDPGRTWLPWHGRRRPGPAGPG